MREQRSRKQPQGDPGDDGEQAPELGPGTVIGIRAETPYRQEDAKGDK